VADQTKGARTESRLEKAAREGGRVPDYETAAQAIREKTARLKALRLAREAAEPKPSPSKPSASKGSRSAKKSTKSSVPLSEWLDDQKGSGRRS
jgi:hypothetical protein